MERTNGSILLSATDLVGHLACSYLTSLNIAVANDALKRPKAWDDPLLQILWERGARHEQAFVNHLRSEGCEVTIIEGVGIDNDAVVRTREAMIGGRQIIVQGAFRTNRWVGRTDILRRVDTPSNLGSWSYEVIDTKLARETKGGTVLQLCLYADLVESCRARARNSAMSSRHGRTTKSRNSGWPIIRHSIGASSKVSINSWTHLALTKNIPSQRNIATSADGEQVARQGAGPTTTFVSWPVFQSSRPTNSGAWV